MTETPRPEEAIFLAALQQPAHERPAYVHQACSGDEALRQRVLELLASHDASCGPLDSPPPGADLTIDQPLERPGMQIGPYKLVEQIGEGGMGTVWMAQQQEPVRRLVAVKVIKPGMDSRQVIARFEAERQALALMDHPNIAKVLDGGTTDAGRPYFVMDLVRGVPITQYCDEHHLTPRERLELFLPICQALQHAHQKGIIHRDLKPSNVLVALYDGRPVPKVIDFGVAKAAGQPLTEQTLVTGFGAIVGTLEYMSPEQAEINQLDIDTRSDIYSLGVLLYELLTGSPPFNRKELEKAGMLEMLRVIREQEPSKPSTKLSTADGLPTLAANRGTEPAKLTKLVRGELDWIVMKALEKDRSRRYETASGFAQDVQRYLADEQVQACPPSVRYKLRKLARKYRVPLMVATGFLSLLVTATVVSGWLAFLAQTRAEAEAKARGEADAAKQQAKAEAQKAKTEAAIAQAINDFLNQDLLSEANADVPYDRYEEPSADLKLRTVLDRAAERLEGRFADQPLVEAALRTTIGRAYCNLNKHDLAALHLTRAVELRKAHLGQDDPNTLISMRYLTWAKHDPDYTARVLEIHRRVLGKDHRVTLSSMFVLALHTRVKGERTQDKRYFARAIELFREALDAQRRALGEDDIGTAWTMHCLAHTLVMNAGKEGIPAADDCEIESLYRRALSVYRTHRTNWHTFVITVALGEFLNLRGRYEEAEALLQDALKRLQSLPGADPEVVARLAQELDAVYQNSGKPNTAKQAVEVAQLAVELEAIELLEQARSLRDQQNFSEAETALHRAIRIKPALLEAHEMLGWTLYSQAKFPEAEAAFRDVLRLNPDHAGGLHGLRVALLRLQKLHEAVALLREAVERDPNNAGTCNELAWVLATCPDAKLRDSKLAVELAQRAVEMEPESDSYWRTLGAGYYRAERWDEALAALEKSCRLEKATDGKGNAWQWLWMAMAHWKLEHKDQACSWYDKAVKLEKAWPEELRRLQTEAEEVLELKK